MTMTVPVSVHRSRNGQLVSPSSAPQTHPRVIREADLAGHLMGVKEAAQFGDHFGMAWLASRGGVQATFEPVEIKALFGGGGRGWHTAMMPGAGQENKLPAPPRLLTLNSPIYDRRP